MTFSSRNWVRTCWRCSRTAFRVDVYLLSCKRVTLLPKKGDLQELHDWRSVSLLCGDYKILSKALA